MKLIKSIFITLFLTVPLLSFGQELSTDPKVNLDNPLNNHNFKINSVGLFINLGDISYEYRLSQHLTFGGSVLVGKFETKSGIYDFDIKTSGGNLKANWYYNDALSDSFYTSLYGGVLSFNVELKNSSTDANLSFSTPYIGAMTGYTWFWDHFNFSFGLGYNHAFEDDEAEIKVDGVSGTTTVRVHTKLALEVAFGWSF